MPRRKQTDGFTLLELMIVVFILAVLAAILVPNFVRARYKAHLTSCITNVRSIAGALETYRTEFALYPAPGVLSPGHVLFTGKYIQPGQIRCPSNYTNYDVETTTDNFTLRCQGIHSFFLDVDPNYPQYSPAFGLRTNAP
ncbi:MAG: prepilin-type N-terminal cleavage/methylation domain-containing protein [Candidatus Eremiobacterota bacterium]